VAFTTVLIFIFDFHLPKSLIYAKDKRFDRTFPAIEDNGLLPGIIERLDGTAARLVEKIAKITDSSVSASPDGKWSVKKEIGHLTDLERCGMERFHQILADNPAMKVGRPRQHNKTQPGCT